MVGEPGAGEARAKDFAPAAVFPKESHPPKGMDCRLAALDRSLEKLPDESVANAARPSLLGAGGSFLPGSLKKSKNPPNE
jgi:hypothetical protein